MLIRKQLLCLTLFFPLLFGARVLPSDMRVQAEYDCLASLLEYDSTQRAAEYEKLLGFKVDSNCHMGMLNCVIDWLGIPYKRGGISRSGVDCSGFVLNVYKDVFGIELMHSSIAMLGQVDERIKKPHLRQGDLLFFKTRGSRVSHVGIYLGDNKFAHSSSNRGVVIDDLTNPYYRRTYFTAGRILVAESAQ